MLGFFWLVSTKMNHVYDMRLINLQETIQVLGLFRYGMV